MTQWAEKNTIQCEVVKIAMSQDRNGHILKLSIHPNELPNDLVLDPLGSRYVMVLAKLNDQDEVEAPKEKSEGEKIVDVAGLLCRNERFVDWLFRTGRSDRNTTEGAIDTVRRMCGIKSRSEFRTNPEARKAFRDLKFEFEAAVKNSQVP